MFFSARDKEFALSIGDLKGYVNALFHSKMMSDYSALLETVCTNVLGRICSTTRAPDFLCRDSARSVGISGTPSWESRARQDTKHKEETRRYQVLIEPKGADLPPDRGANRRTLFRNRIKITPGLFSFSRELIC